MGGYGAIKLALQHPDVFASANGHSGAYGFAHGAWRDQQAEFTRIIGPNAIGGKDDVAVPVESLLPQLALPTESHALLLSDVGHLGYFEEPDLTRRAVVDFAGRVYEPKE